MTQIRISLAMTGLLIGLLTGCGDLGLNDPFAPPAAPLAAPAASGQPAATARSPEAGGAFVEIGAAPTLTPFGRSAGAIGLFGEMPGSPRSMPEDELGNIRQVSFTREGADFDVDVARDGKFMVFASTRHRPTADLYFQNIGGNTVTQLTADLANDTMPAISPRGDRIAFCSDRSGSWDIYVQELSGGQAVQITSDPAHEIHPSWSADGNQLVFSALGAQSGQWEMVVVDVAHAAQRRFIGYGLFPQFSPNGDKILFQRARFRGTRWFSVWTVDYDNGEGKRPTEIAASSNAAIINPAWSPDGERIVFATVVDPGNDPGARPDNADLWTVHLDGTGRVCLSSDGFVNLQPVWAADGNIYFVSNRNGHDNLWSVSPDPAPGGVNGAVAGAPTGP